MVPARLTLVPLPGPHPFTDLGGRLADRSAIVAVVGLGYVGLPLLLAAAEAGFGVVGVDTDAGKVRSLREGRSHVVDVADEAVTSQDHVQFTTDPRVLVAADVVVLAVPTPLRNGGTVSVVGVYGGVIDKFPMGSLVNRSLTLKTGQCHVQRYMRPLLERIQNGEIDPSFVMTHRLPLSEASRGYETFKNKQDNCMKVVLAP